jgi:AcrR family transcriptional regulator
VSKGAETKERIVERAFRLATRDGLEGLTIGTLAKELGLSKSGLFAHFGSKEELQLEVLKSGQQRFQDQVLAPAFKLARGEPRLKAIFEGWMRWLNDPANVGGCLFMTASVELDDHPGRPRDLLVGTQRQLLDTVAKAARLGIDAGHFRADLDCDQVAFEIDAILLGYNQLRRLMQAPEAEARARAAFERLLRDARIRS